MFNQYPLVDAVTYEKELNNNTCCEGYEYREMKVKLSLCLNWAPRPESVLVEWVKV
jgi:hypothetical protein